MAKSKRAIFSALLTSAIAVTGSLFGPASAQGASDTWTGATNGSWSTSTNWVSLPAIVPGTGDTATFNAASANTVIDLGAGVTINTILFDTSAAAAYTIGAGALNSQTLTLNEAGAVTMNATVANGQLFNSAVILGTSVTGNSAYTFTNNSTSGLTLAGNISGSSSTGVKTFTVTGTGNTLISGSISNAISGTGSVAFTKSGAGTLTLAGANSYTGATLLTAGKLILTNGAALANTSTLTFSSGTTLDLATNGVDSPFAMNFGTTSVITIVSDVNSGSVGITHTLGTMSAGGGTINVTEGAGITSGTPSISFGTLTLSAGSVQTTTINPTTAVVALSSVLGVAANGNIHTLDLDGTIAGNVVTGIIANGNGGATNTNLLKSNTSTWALQAASTFTGTTTVTGGVLDLQNSLALQNSILVPSTGTVLFDSAFGGANFTVGALSGAVAQTLQNSSAAGLNLTVNPGFGLSSTYSGVLSDGGANGRIIKTGLGTQVLSGANTYAGGTTVTSGILQFAKIIAMPASGTVVVNNGGVLAVNIGGTGEFTVAGTGAGTLAGLLAGTGGQGAAITWNSGAVLGLDTTNLAGGTLTFNPLTFGSIGIAKLGTGTLTLLGTSTSTGGVTINAGTLNINSAGALGSGTFAFNGGTVNNNSGTNLTGVSTLSADIVYNGPNNVNLGTNAVTLLANRTLTVNSGTLTEGGAISGAFTLTKAGLGTLVLGGANTYTGTTTVTGPLNVTGTLGSGALTLIGGGPSTVNFSEAAGSTQTVGALTFSSGDGNIVSTYPGSGTSTLTFASLAARTARATGNFTVSGGVNGSTNLIKFTAAPTAATLLDKGLFFGGSSYAAYDAGGFLRAYSYTGTPDTGAVASAGGATFGAVTSTSNVQITGAITAQTAAAINTLNISGSNNVTLTGQLNLNGILKSGGNAATISGGSLMAGASGTEIVIRTDLATDSLTIGSNILATGTNAFTKTGAGTLTLNGANTFSGAMAIDGGTLAIGPTGTLVAGTYAGAIANFGTLVDNFTGTAPQTFSGILSGTGNLIVNGTTGGGPLTAQTPTLSLTAANTYTGGTTVNGGELSIVGGNASGLGTGAVTINGGDVLIGDGLTVTNNFILNGGGLFTRDGTNLLSGSLTINAGATPSFIGERYDSKILNVSGQVFGSGNVTIQEALAPFNVNGTSFRGDNVHFSNANVSTYNGTITIAADGFTTLYIDATSALANATINVNGATGNPNSTVNGSARPFVFGNGITAATIGGLTGLGNVDLRNNLAASLDLSVGNNNTNQTFAGVLTGTGRLIMIGSGTQTLTGTNTYTGDTSINGGTLQLGNGTTNGSIAGFNIVNNATLALNPAGSFSYSNMISGGGVVNKVGAGTAILTNPNTYTGPTLITGGKLLSADPGNINTSSGITVNGAGASFVQTASTAVTPTVTVINGTVDGTTTINSVHLVDSALASIANGNGVPGTALTINALTLDGNATLKLAINPSLSTAAVLDIGTLTTKATNSSGAVTINVSNANSWVSGTYDLINFGSYSHTGSAPTDFVAGTFTSLGGHQHGVLAFDGNNIALIVTGQSPVWTGLVDGRWTTNAIGGFGNWAVSSGPTEFIAGDAVLFDDSGPNAGGTPNVTIANANVSLTGLTFNNFSYDYTISSSSAGNFGFVGGFLTMNGGATTTINTNNSYSGPTSVNSGTLIMTGNNTLGGAIVVTNATAVLSGNNAFGAGVLSLNGGNLTLAGANTGTGGVTVNSGNLNINNNSALGTGPLNLAAAVTIDNTSASPVALTTANVQTWNGGFTYGGTQNLNLGTGAVTMLGSTTITETNSSTAALTVGGPISGAGLNFAFDGQLGTLALSGNNTYTGTTRIVEGTVNLTGKLNANNVTTGEIFVGTTFGTNAVLNVAGGTINATAGRPSIVTGFGVGTNGFITLSSGGVITTNSELWLGNGNGAYNAFTMTSGTVTTGSYLAVGFQGDNSVINQSGGAITVSANVMTIGAGDSTSHGVYNISGTGTFTSTSSSGGMWVGELGTATLNVSGSAVVSLANIGLTVTNRTTAVGMVNLMGGTIATNKVANGGPGNAIFNFNGGKLKATVANATFMTGLTNAYVYGGGATIDDGGFAITIGQALQAPTGSGLTSISVDSGGSGYIDTPLITLSGGSGTGAQAVAVISGGAVTGFNITNPGTGYLSTDVLGVSFAGGGGTGASAGITTTFAPNVSGGLNKMGSGVTTFTAVSTYTGPTTVSAGTLRLTGAGSINGSSVITVNTGGTLQPVSSAAVSVPVTINSGGTLSGTGGAASLNTVLVNAGGIISNQNGNTTPLTVNTLTFSGGGTIALAIGSQATPELAVGTLSTTAGVITINASSPSWSVGTYNLISYSGSIGGNGSGSFLLAPPSGLSARQFAATTLTNPPGFISLTIGAAGASPVWTGAFSSNWTTAAIPSPKNWNSGGPTDFIATDTVVFDDTASATALVTGGATTVNILDGTVAPTSTTFNNNALGYILSSTGGFGITSGLVTFNGTGTVTINTANSYAGGTTINSGTVNLGNAAALSTGGVTINGGKIDNTSGAPLTLTNAINVNAGFTYLGTAQPLTLGTVTSAGAGTTQGVTVAANTLSIGQIASASSQGFTIAGAGTVSMSGATASTVAGTLTVNGNLLLNAQSLTVAGLAGTGTIANGSTTARTLTVSGAANSTFGGVISNGGSGTLAVSNTGTGILAFSGANTFSGGITMPNNNAASIEADSSSVFSVVGGNIVITSGPFGTGGLNFTGNDSHVIRINGGNIVANSFNSNFGFGGVTNVSGNNTFSGGITDTSNAHGATMTSLSGTLTLTGSAATGLIFSTTSSVPSPASNRFLIMDGAGNGIITGNLNNGPTTGLNLPVTKNGTGTWTLANTANTYSGGLTINAGTLLANGFTLPASVNGANVVINNTGTYGLVPTSTPHSAVVSVSAGAFSSYFTFNGILANGNTTLTSSGKLSLGNNDLIITGGAFMQVLVNGVQAPVGAVQVPVERILAAPTLVGGAYVTSGVLTDAQYTALTGQTTFDGSAFSGGGDLLMRYGYAGDINFSGKIEADDYVAIDEGYLEGLTGYANGDINHDGVVNASDYAMMDFNYLNQSGALADGEISLHTQEFGATYTDAFNALSVAAVPEPASLMLLGAGAIGLLARRRRR